MGGHRRNRGQPSHHPKKAATPSPIPNPPLYTEKPKGMDGATNLDFNKILQDVEGSFQVTWKEILWIVAGVLVLALLSILVGIAAGMTISIHYYDSSAIATTTTTSPAAAHSFHVTTLDPGIASSNVLKGRDGLDLGRVITTTATGQRNILSVVEETTPLEATHFSAHGPKAHYDGIQPPFMYNRYERQSITSSRLGRSVSNGVSIELSPSTVLPKLCSDGVTWGFDDWYTLKAAVQEANALSAERFMKWNEFFVRAGPSFVAFDDASLYYEEDVVFRICPGSTLKAYRGPIFINAENVIIECENDCTLSVGGTHLAFGPHAKNVLVRGINFQRAHTSSLTFYHDGAEASFEDCVWFGNTGMHGKFGAVADVNSTSTVNFYRCEIGQSQNSYGGMTPSFASSLTIRA